MKKLLISYLLLIAVQLSLFSQNRHLSGKVTDNAGLPLEGVTVLVKGSKAGVQTIPEAVSVLLFRLPVRFRLFFPIPVIKRLPSSPMGLPLFRCKWKKRCRRWKMWW